ncbi:MAG TPA: hypothetical protein VFV87_11630, partial [Pirellulaceae bacterium]|nr:hypothetical protein [Pirellulaceae bacterium]
LARGRGLQSFDAAPTHRGGRLQLDRLALGEALADAEAKDGITASEFGYTANAISPQTGKLVESARALFEKATGKEAPADRSEVQRLVAKACLYDTAAANVGQSDGGIAFQAIEKLEELHAADVKDWSAKLPQLKTKLDLVIRDQSLAEALDQVATAAKIDINLLEGSVADATALIGPDAARVSYLDLRHATTSQALDWILQPARLTWRVDGKAVVAGSERRRAGESGWTYDVGAIALPLEKDLTDLNDYNKAVEAAKKAADEFLAAVRKELKADDETSVTWFAPGQLLVIGQPDRHAAVTKLIATLQEGKTKPTGALSAISEVTRTRYAARKESVAKAAAAEALLNVAAAHDQFSWQLLSAAAGGELDLEALTELQIAWKSPQTAELLGGAGRPLAMRSLWTIGQAAKALPGETELAALAAEARKQLPAAAEAALAAAEKDKNDQAALASVLYAVLANPSDETLRGKAAELFAVQSGEDSAADLRLLGRMLVGNPAATDAESLRELVAKHVAGPDAVVLTALACRQAGGEAWDQFRAESRDLLGGQPLPGEVVALINRLDQSSTALARTGD